MRDDAGTDLEMPVDVFQTEAARQHQNLDVVEELGDLFGGFFVALVFGGHPDFSRFLDVMTIFFMISFLDCVLS